MQKPDLVIIHSFPSNTRLWRGFYELLGDFFTVHPIDLPGFTPEKKPLKTISLRAYATHVEQEIERLQLASYLLAGISFGFSIAPPKATAPVSATDHWPPV